MRTITKPKRFYFYNWGTYLTYKMVYSNWYNEYKHETWESWSEWFAFIAFRPKPLFNFGTTEYDGHYVRSICLLGITFGYGFTYDSAPITFEVTDDEIPAA